MTPETEQNLNTQIARLTDLYENIRQLREDTAEIVLEAGYDLDPNTTATGLINWLLVHGGFSAISLKIHCYDEVSVTDSVANINDKIYSGVGDRTQVSDFAQVILSDKPEEFIITVLENSTITDTVADIHSQVYGGVGDRTQVSDFAQVICETPLPFFFPSNHRTCYSHGYCSGHQLTTNERNGARYLCFGSV